MSDLARSSPTDGSERSEEQLLKLSRAVEQSACLVIITDVGGRIEYVNPKFMQVTGYTPAEVVGRTPRILKSGRTDPEGYRRLWETITAGGQWHGEFQNRTKDGRLYWASASISPIRNPRGMTTHFVGIQEDITALKRAEEALREANEQLERRVRERTAELIRANEALRVEVVERRRIDRARQALSRCNQALVRARDEASFLEELCRLIVEVAGYRLCWIGYAERDEAKTVRPVAHAGYEAGYLGTVNVTWADTDRGHGPVGTAIRARRPAIFRDVARDPDFAPWRAEALRRGYASVLGVPLLSGPEILGALAIYATEPDAFDEEEVRLLVELAADLSYGVDTLRTRAERARVEEALQRAYEGLERRVEERTADLSQANALLTREIAERERAEEALRASERLYPPRAPGFLAPLGGGPWRRCAPPSGSTASSPKGSSTRSSWPTSGA